jgi:nucleoside-diphosphate-sugar epimerase
MNVLITGHRGFIGRHLHAALAAQHHHVVGLDLVDGRDCRDEFRYGRTPYDLVFHCAATVGGREGIDYNAALLGASNLQLDGGLFDWALRTRPSRIVYFSSAASYPVSLQNGTYASTGYRLHERDIDLRNRIGMPDNTYGWAKVTGEILAEHVRKAGVPVTVVRPFSSYDWDQDPAYPWHQFALRAHRQDDPFIVWGDGTQVRDFIHIDDIVGAVLTLVDKRIDGPVNLGTGVGMSMDDLARLFMAAAGYQAPIRHLEDKPMGVMHRVCDNTLLRRYYQPKFSVEEGIRRSLAALAQPPVV